MSSRASSNPSPTQRPVATITRGASGGVAAIASAIARRLLTPIPPDITNTLATDSLSAAARPSRCSVRSVSTSGERPAVTAASTSATMSSRGRSLRRARSRSSGCPVATSASGIVNAVLPHHDPVVEGSRFRLAPGVCAVPYRTALHGDDRLVSVAAHWRRGEAHDVVRLHLSHHLFKAEGRKVVALVDDHLPVSATRSATTPFLLSD